MTNQSGCSVRAFVDKLNERFGDEYLFDLMPGRKNIRITKANVRNGVVDEWSKSSYCFIRKEDGAILKCDSWKKPAKGVRAWLSEVLANDLEGVDQYTGWLYRGR